MKYCPSCHAEYQDKVRFCRLDGTALVIKPATTPDGGAGHKEQVAVEQSKEVPHDATADRDVSPPLETVSQNPAKYCPVCNSEYAEKFRFCRVDGATLIAKRVFEEVPSESKTEQTIQVDSSGVSSKPDNGEEVTEPQKSPDALADKTSNEENSGLQRDDGSGDYVANGESAPQEGPDLKTDNQERMPATTAAERFELRAQDEIKKSFPTAFVRAGVQIRSWRRSAEVDLFVLMPKGLFLVECKNYSGKIRGSLNYDQKQGELWTCETATGEIVQITSSGKNPADQALTRFHALHDMAKEAWGEANRPYIYPVLVFPDAANLSEITQMTVNPERPATADRVVATTLSKLLGYLANTDSVVEQTGALKLLDFLGIPRASLSGSWLDKPIETGQRTRPSEGTDTPGGSDQDEVDTPIDGGPDVEFDEKNKDEFATASLYGCGQQRRPRKSDARGLAPDDVINPEPQCFGADQPPV